MEYAAIAKRNADAYRSLAEKSGRPLDEVLQLAEADELRSLFGPDGRLRGNRPNPEITGRHRAMLAELEARRPGTGRVE